MLGVVAGTPVALFYLWGRGKGVRCLRPAWVTLGFVSKRKKENDIIFA